MLFSSVTTPPYNDHILPLSTVTKSIPGELMFHEPISPNNPQNTDRVQLRSCVSYTNPNSEQP
ncbi:hypothetical protein Hanom_Chr16g01522461 [Helianthus anomalus]